MGDIRNITFSNIYVNGFPGLDRLLSDSRLQGYSAQHDIQGVCFENVEILGKTVHDAESCGLLCLEHVRGRILPAESGSGAALHDPHPT